jgi:hypothetical protein
LQIAEAAQALGTELHTKARHLVAREWNIRVGVDVLVDPDRSRFKLARDRVQRGRIPTPNRRSRTVWSGGPVNAFTLWKPDAVRISAGAEHVGIFQKTPVSQRQYCKKCGGHLMTNHPPLGLVDVFAATLPTLKFTPGVHINYAETVLPMRDGLPKLKDFPAEFGGSGERIAE